jgi:hypothetical protein
MKNKHRKIWTHIIICVSVLAYLFLAPDVYASIFLKQGRPVDVKLDLPVPTMKIRYAVDRMDSITVKGQHLLNLSGWAFLPNEKNQQDFDRWIVLQSNERVYFYLAIPRDRVDIRETFSYLNLYLPQTGFSIFVSKDFIQTGKYNIGVMFKHKTNGAVYYIVTDRTLVRTPNQLQAETPNLVNLNLELGHPDQLNQNLVTSTREIRYFIDGLDSITVNRRHFYNLWGWSFLMDGKDQLGYDRWIVLQSTKNTYFYSAKKVERDDVQQSFASLDLDLTESGFSAYIASNSIQPGTYKVGLLFKHQSTEGVTDYIPTTTVLTYIEGQLTIVVAAK